MLVADLSNPENSSEPLFDLDDNLGRVGGASINFNRAHAKAVGEAIERYALYPRPYEDKLISTYGKLIRLQDDVFDPDLIVAGADKIPASRQIDTFGWTKVSNIANGRLIYLPQQLVDVPYMPVAGEIVLKTQITTGAASHITYSQSVLAGLYEVWERDLFTKSWLSQLKLKSINYSQTKNNILKKTIYEIARYGFDVRFYDLDAPSPFYCALCVIEDKNNIVPISIGASFFHDPSICLLKAVEEAFQLRPWLRMLAEENSCKEPQEIATIRDRGLYSLTSEAVDGTLGWLDSPKSVIWNEVPATENPAEFFLEKCAFATIKNGGTPLVAVTTHRIPKFLRKRFVSCKVIVPEFQPLFLDERYKDIAWGRIGGVIKCRTTHLFL